MTNMPADQWREYDEATKDNARKWIESIIGGYYRKCRLYNLDLAAERLHAAADESHASRYSDVTWGVVDRILEDSRATYEDCTEIQFIKRFPYIWPDSTEWESKTIPVSDLAQECSNRWHALNGERADGDGLPSRASAADMTVEQLADWYVELNDPNTIFSVTPRWDDEDLD